MTRDSTVSPSLQTSLVGSVIHMLFAFEQPFHDGCAPRYLGGFVREPLCKIDVILLHDVEHRFFGAIAMVSGEQPVHRSDFFFGHGLLRPCPCPNGIFTPLGVFRKRNTIASGLLMFSLCSSLCS
jgi:hypothetical protein